jgi:hypothetical protein
MTPEAQAAQWMDDIDNEYGRTVDGTYAHKVAAQLLSIARQLQGKEIQALGLKSQLHAATERETALQAAIQSVLYDADLEENYESRESDGRFVTKVSLLRCRAALTGGEEHR